MRKGFLTWALGVEKSLLGRGRVDLETNAKPEVPWWMKRQGVHRKLRDETAEWEAVITEVTPPPPTPGTKSEEHVRHTLTTQKLYMEKRTQDRAPGAPNIQGAEGGGS